MDVGLYKPEKIAMIRNQLDDKKKAKLINSTSASGEWEPPLPFENINVPPFPVDCLPDTLKDYVLAVSESTQTPIDMAATASIAVMAVCVQGKFKIKVKPDWTEPLNLYSLIIADSGEKKSVILREMIQFINQYELEYNEDHKEEIAQNRKELDMLQKELDDLTSRATRETTRSPASKQEVFDKLREINNFEIKRELCLLSDDSTPEALVSLMAENKGMISTISSEGGIFNTLSGRYSNSPNIDVFLKAYSGDRIKVHRKGREAEDIPNPCATVLLTVQPDVIDELMANMTFRRRGLNARFLYSMPSSLFGSRHYVTQAVPAALREKYKELCYDLLDIKIPKSPMLLNLSKEAAQLSEKFFYELEERLIDDLEPIRDFAAKLQGNIARIAGILHITDNYRFIFEEEAAVSDETMQKAINIGYYFLEHAIAAFQRMGVDERVRDAKYILKKLEKEKPDKISKRDLLRLCRRFKTTEQLDVPLLLLLENGYFKELEATRSGNNQPLIIYAVNPLTYVTSTALLK